MLGVMQSHPAQYCVYVAELVSLAGTIRSTNGPNGTQALVYTTGQESGLVTYQTGYYTNGIVAGFLQNM